MRLALACVPTGSPTAGELEEVVGDLRRRRVTQMRRPEDRWHRILADRLLRSLLAGRAAWRHDYSAGGRPVVEGAHLSVSHDTTLVVAAVADTPVGIDVVDIARLRHLRPELVLSDHERRRPGPVTTRLLAETWAAKEAATKRWGVGLALDPRRLTLTGSGPTGTYRVGDDERSCLVQVAPLGRTHLLATTSESLNPLSNHCPHPLPGPDRTFEGAPR